MKKSPILFLLALLNIEAFSQIYPFDSISAELRKRADAIVRSDQCLFTIEGPGKAVEKVKFVVTITNERADRYGKVEVYYNNFTKIKYLRGAVYNERGDLVNEIGSQNIKDEAAITGATFYSDDRVKRFTVSKQKYPYTVEYEYEIEYNGILNYPEWNFQSTYGISVEKSGIQIVVPKDMQFKYYERNLKNASDSIILEDKRIYTWQEENLPAVVKPSSVLHPVYRVPTLFTAPYDFEIDGYKGSMNSWKEFGEWEYSLIKDQDRLPENEISKVNEIVSGSRDTREKVRLLYEYMQSKTRYVAISIGIGGWRPADATSVATNGFGDCKALSNYMKALLKASGITSYYTGIYAGDEKRTNINFISNYFNHAILCVPMEADTVWLECTDSNSPFNYLSDFTDDRPALLITPEGGKMVKTPAFSKEDNLFRRTGEVSIHSIGSSIAKVSNSYSGYHYGNASLLYRTKSEDELRKSLYSNLRFHDFIVNSVSYKEEKSEDPQSVFKYSLTVNDLTVNMGKRIYFNPTIVRESYISNSPTGIRIPQSEIISDSISYYLPVGYKVEYLPADVEIESEFGKFMYSLEARNEKVIYRRYLEFNKGDVPIEKFKELKEFINSIAKADRQNIILTN